MAHTMRVIRFPGAMPARDVIAAAFHAVTGIALEWDLGALSAPPLRGDLEVGYAPGGRLRLMGVFRGYFAFALLHALRSLGGLHRYRVPRYATVPWQSLPGWRRWLHG